MAAKDSKKDERQAIKMPKTAAGRARELSEIVSRQGWASVGVDRNDPPTITAIVEAAIDLLYARATAKRK
jgi:hypothetical protein